MNKKHHLIYSYNEKSSVVCIESMWNDHWSIMKPAYFTIWFSFNINFRFSIKWYSRAQKVVQHKYVKFPAVWKQYNKMAVLHFFLLNSPLIYILFSLQTVYPTKKKRVLPTPKRFYRKTIKVNLLNLESKNQAKNIPVGLPSSPIKIWGKLVPGFLSCDRTNKQP